MIVRHITIRNFRCIKSGLLLFPGHALLVGPNNVGKSTVLEALDLVLGPERSGRPDTIDEHDFYQGKYLPADGEDPPAIHIEVILTHLSEQSQRLFQRHLEWWHDGEKRLLRHDELSPEATDAHSPALRVAFRGWYDEDEDEFATETYFCHPPQLPARKPTHFGVPINVPAVSSTSGVCARAPVL